MGHSYTIIRYFRDRRPVEGIDIWATHMGEALLLVMHMQYEAYMLTETTQRAAYPFYPEFLN